MGLNHPTPCLTATKTSDEEFDVPPKIVREALHVQTRSFLTYIAPTSSPILHKRQLTMPTPKVLDSYMMSFPLAAFLPKVTQKKGHEVFLLLLPLLPNRTKVGRVSCDVPTSNAMADFTYRNTKY
jgi:hypothetical protein